MQTFLPLDAAEEQELRAMLKAEEATDVDEFVETWADRALARGIQQGIQEGVLSGQRNALLKVIRARFGGAPETLAARVERMTDSAALDRLLEQAIVAKTIEEIEPPQQ